MMLARTVIAATPLAHFIRPLARFGLRLAPSRSIIHHIHTSSELLPAAERWKAHFTTGDRVKIETLLLEASGAGNSKEAQYRIGTILVAEMQPLKETEVASTASQVRADIARIRKRPSIKGGSRADFEKAKKLREEKSSAKSGGGTGKVLVVDSSAAARQEKDSLAFLKTEGMKWIELAAMQGHSEAQCYLGNDLLRRGLDVADLRSCDQKAADVLRAKELYEAASREGCGEASFNLGVMLHDGVVVEPPTLLPTDGDSADQVVVTKVSNKTNALAAESARESDKKSSIVVSAVAEDLPGSLVCFELAAQQGEAAASLWCGYCHSTGEGGAGVVDREKALAHLRVAAADLQTAAKAHAYLSQLHRQASEGREAEEVVEGEEAAYLRHLRTAVSLGDEDAQYTLADLHLKAHMSAVGEEDDLSDAELAFVEADCRNQEEVHTCGDSGHVHGAQCAHHHVNARGGGHLERSMWLLREASAAGQASATLTLGALVYQGLVRSDPAAAAESSHKRSAFELYSLAAEQGSLEAWRNIASMHYLGDGVPKCEKTAREIMRVVFGKP